MFNDQQRYLLLLHITLDLICLTVSYYLLIPLFLFYLNESSIAGLFYNSFLFVGLPPGLIFVSVFFSVIFKKYWKNDIQNFRDICHQSVIISFFLTGSLLSISIFFFDFSLKDDLFFSFISVSWLLPSLALNRFYILQLLKKGALNSNLIKHLLIAGTGPKAKKIADCIEKHPEYGFRVTGFLTNQENEIGKTISNKTVLGTFNNLRCLVCEHYTDCVLYTDNSGSSQELERVFKNCCLFGIDFATTEIQDFTALNVDDSILLYKKRFVSEYIFGIELKMVKAVDIGPNALFLKRVFDFIISSALITLLFPIGVVIAILIKVSSSGAVFFKQERVGKYGKKFMLLKFRSMVDGAEMMQSKLMHLNEMDGPAFKIKNDPRLTVVGKFLRKTSLDELPQLLNVFRGDISLVGPRPALEDEVFQYRPIERRRLSVIQGITCIWQISGRNTIKFEEWMKLDLMYIDNWSLALDLRILLKTIPAIVFKKGAY